MIEAAEKQGGLPRSGGDSHPCRKERVKDGAPSVVVIWAEKDMGGPPAAVPLALDAAGLVPGELQVVAAGQTLAGFGSIVSSMIQKDWEGAGYGTVGTVTTVTSMAATEMGASWAKAVPIVGYGVNALSTIHDLWGTISTGLQAYKTCMGAH